MKILNKNRKLLIFFHFINLVLDQCHSLSKNRYIWSKRSWPSLSSMRLSSRKDRVNDPKKDKSPNSFTFWSCHQDRRGDTERLRAEIRMVWTGVKKLFQSKRGKRTWIKKIDHPRHRKIEALFRRVLLLNISSYQIKDQRSKIKRDKKLLHFLLYKEKIFLSTFWSDKQPKNRQGAYHETSCWFQNT